MQRRQLVAAGLGLLVVVPEALVASEDSAAPVLALYGLDLRHAPLAAFVRAAEAAGNRPRRNAAGQGDGIEFDAQGAGVPALQRLQVQVHEGQVAAVRFTVKGYGEDNVALRRLLMGKYGVPFTVSPRPLPFSGFADRMAPRGGFQWRFAGGMRLVYEHPRVGDVTLSYLNDERLARLDAASPAPKASAPVLQRF